MINIGAGPSNDPYEISSNTQFHQRLDQLMESNPQQHLNEILEVLGKGIQYISEQDAQFYLPTIKSKLIQEQVNSNDPVIAKINEKINEICTTLEKGKTLKDLPQDVLISFLKQWDKKTQNTFRRTALDFQQLMQDPEVLASILESEKYVDYHDLGKITDHPIPLEIKLEMAKKAGHLLHLLTFNNTPLLDQQLQDVLKACPNLKVLNLIDCPNLTNEGIKNLPTNLKVLTLRDCLTSFMMEEAFKNLPQTLERLYLHQAWSLGDEALENLPINLKELHLTRCYLLTNQGIKNLPANLERLVLYDCLLKKDELEGLPQTLKTLRLTGKFSLEDEQTKNLPKNLDKLELIGCDLTDESLKHLPKDLRMLNLFWCNGLTDEGFKNLPKNLKKLAIHGKKSPELTQEGIKNNLPTEVLTSIKLE